MGAGSAGAGVQAARSRLVSAGLRGVQVWYGSRRLPEVASMTTRNGHLDPESTPRELGPNSITGTSANLSSQTRVGAIRSFDPFRW